MGLRCGEQQAEVSEYVCALRWLCDETLARRATCEMRA